MLDTSQRYDHTLDFVSDLATGNYINSMLMIFSIFGS